MPINAQNFTAPVSCYDVPQRYGAVSRSTVLGTTMMMNCIGIVMWGQGGNAAALAHLEASSPQANYQDRFNTTIVQMLDALRIHGGVAGPVDAAFTGNMTGSIDITQIQGNAIININDLRHGAFGLIGTMTIDPSTGNLCVASHTHYYEPIGSWGRGMAWDVKDLNLP